MPAYFNQGFFVREPAWHGLGIVLPEYPGREEAMRLAGHAFTIAERPVFDSAGVIDSHKVLFREDTGKRLNVASKSYTIVQNSTAWDVVDAIVAQPNVKYDTAGILRDGAIAWVMAFLDEPVRIDGDASFIYPYVSCSWAHDGSAALVVRRHAVRIVCANTHAAADAEAKASGRVFSFRHTLNVMQRIDAAREALLGIRTGFQDFVDMSNELARLTVSDQGIAMFIDALRPRATELVSDRVRENEDKDRATILGYLNGPTINAEIRNTAYGLVQAGVEFLDHGRKYRNNETLLNRQVLSGEPLKDKLVTLARRASELYPMVAA